MTWKSLILRCGFFLYLVLLAVLCLIPSDDVVHLGMRDKFLHAAAYGIGAVLANLSFAPRLRIPLLGALFFWGVVIEVGQLFVPGRSFEYADMAANGAGLILASLPFFLIRVSSRSREA